MVLIVGQKGSGRTTKLIQMCAENKGSVIVCPTKRHAEYLAKTAKDMGYSILHPISFTEFLEGTERGTRISGYYFDNLDLSLQLKASRGLIYGATFALEPSGVSQSGVPLDSGG